MLAVTVLCGAALGLIGYWPTLRVAGGPGVAGMLVGIAMSVTAGALGSIPVALAMVGDRDKVPTAVLGATCIRFLVVLLLVASLGWTDLLPRVPMVAWVAISYLVLLLVDTLGAVSSLRALREVRS